MSNPTPILNNINAFDATKGTTISFNIIGGTDIVRSNIVYIYDLSTNDLICTHLYISTESIHELPPNTDSSIVYASGKSSADFVNNKNYYLQIQTFTNTAGTAGGSGMSVAKTFWCLFNPALSVNAIPAAISTTSYNFGATYTTNITDVTIPVTNIIQQYKFDLYTATGTLVQTSGNIIGSGEQEGTSTTYNITYNFSGLVVNNSYYVIVTTTSTEGMTVSAQSNTFTVSIDTPTVGGAIVNNNACDGYISVVSNLSDEYGGSASGEMASFETDSVNNVSSLKVNMEPIQGGSGTPSPTNIRPIRGHGGVNAYVSPTQSADDGTKYSQEFDMSLTPTSTDKVPYTFKAVGRDIYGDRESDKIVGGTVGWNQLINDTNTFTVASGENKTYTSPNTFAVTSGHKYIAFAKQSVALSSATRNRFGLRVGTNNIYQNTDSLNAGLKTWIYNAETSGAGNLLFWCHTPNADVSFSEFQFHDLTALFNPTIADYIYSLEQSQAGAGVAWFRNYFPKDYYPYDPGTLRSVEGVSAHVTSGKNLLPPSTTKTLSGIKYTVADDGRISISGTASAEDGYVIPFTVQHTGNYYFSGCADNGSFSKYDVYVWDSTNAHRAYKWDGATSSGSAVGSGDQEIYLESGITYQYRIRVRKSFSASSQVFEPMIRLASINDATYEPYAEPTTYPLDSSLTLRGVPKLVDGKLEFDGDVYPPSGEVQRRYGVITVNGSSNVILRRSGTSNSLFGIDGVGSKAYVESKMPNAISDKLLSDTAYNAWRNETPLFAFTTTGQTLWFRLPGITTLADAKTYLTSNPLQVVYELATPTTETAEPFTNPQVVDNGGTEAYVTTGIVPVGHDSEYLTRDVFGGTLDMVTGVLTLTHGYAEYDGSSDESWTGANTRFAIIPDGVYRSGTGRGEVLSNEFAYSSSATTVGTIFLLQSSGQVYVYPPVSDSLANFKTWLASNPLQIVYPLATPQTYQLTPHQIQTLVGQNNVWSDAGNVEVTFNLPISNLLVKRQDASDVSGDWLTLYSQPITQASDMDFTFIDFLNQHGKTYRYALVPLLTQQQGDIDVEIEGGYTVSDDVVSVFDGVFIANNNGSQKLKAATEYGDLETNQDVGVLTTIGNKYPFVVSNSNLNYHSGSISALIVPSDFYTNGDLDRLDIVERREAIEKFLTDKTAKILKDWNGNIWLITFVENVEVSFVDDYGMGLGTLSAKWVEIGDVNDQTDLKQTGLI